MLQEQQGLLSPNSLVTQQELNGWYSFGIATEGYSILCLGIYFPLVLESFSSSIAVESNNHSLPCNTSHVSYDCVVNFGSSFIPTTSLFFYTTTVATIIQFILFISLSSLADYGNYRKYFLLRFGYSTAITGFLIIFATSIHHWAIPFLSYFISSINFGASFVFFYAWTPILIRNHPKVVDAIGSNNYVKVSEQVGNEISSKQFGYAYIAAVIQMIIASVFALAFGDGKKYGLPAYYGLQIGIAFSCLWTFITIHFYTRTLLLDRPGPPLPQGSNFITYSFTKLYSTLKNAKQLPELYKFLAFWFIYSDGFGTIGTVAILYAQSELGADQQMLLLAGIVAPLCAALGNFFWTWFQNRLHWTTRQILLLHIVLYTCFPIYCVIFLRQASQILFLAAWHGFLVGATQSSCRVLFSELIPAGSEAEFFGLYEITDKGSAWIGPLMIGIIRNTTGNLRDGMYFLILFLSIPSVFLYMIDCQKGKSDAQAFETKNFVPLQKIKM